MGLSGGPLEIETGVCIEDVVESSSPATSSCGLDAVGVVDGEIFKEDDKLTPAELDEKFLNMAKIESALDGFCFKLSFVCFFVSARSDMLELSTEGIAKSELVNESLP